MRALRHNLTAPRINRSQLAIDDRFRRAAWRNASAHAWQAVRILSPMA